MGERPKWWNSFVLVPKVNGKVRLCLDPARLYKALIRPVHRCPTMNDILLRWAGLKYLALICVSSAYHNMRLDEMSSYLTTFSCPFGRYRYKRLPFRAAPARDMFQKKVDGLFGIVDDIFYCRFLWVGLGPWWNIREGALGLQSCKFRA